MRMRILLAALVAIAGCTGGDDDDDAGPDATWTTMAPLAGGPRQETAVVAADVTSNGGIYVLGGFDENGTIVADVERFQYTGGPAGWVDAPALPVPMHHANAAFANGRLWVLGFLTAITFEEDGRVFSLDPATGVWAEGPSMPAGTERGSSGVATDGTNIWLLGGIRGGAAVADVSVFATTTGTSGTWTALTPLPAPRDHLVAAENNGVVFAIGGRAAVIESHVSEVLAFDTATPANGWTPRSPMPTSRGGAAAAQTNDFVVVFGGEGNPDDASGVFDAVEGYDMLTDEWTVFPPMPNPRHGTGAAKLDEFHSWVIPGGADVQAFGAVDTVESWYPEPPDGVIVE